MDRKIIKEMEKIPADRLHKELRRLSAGDVTKPWKRQFFETKMIGPEPPINAAGFWRTPKHGIYDKVKTKRKQRDDSSHNAGS